MVRKLKNVDKEVLEEIVRDSVKRIGISNLEDNKAALLFRLIISGIGSYFFLKPDDIVDVGFLRFKKNPDKDELFAVDILRSREDGVVNADTLYRYYKGELAKEGELKEALEGFVSELLSYSQTQEMNITQLTSNLSRRKRKGEKKNGI